MNELTVIETHAVTGGIAIENLPLMVPSAILREALAALAREQEQAELRFLQHLAD